MSTTSDRVEIRNCVFWDGEKNSVSQATLRRQIDAMDEEGQAYWREKLPWVFEDGLPK